MEDFNENKPIIPMTCPRCGKKTEFKDADRFICKECGELYFDDWLGIWRVKPVEHES